MLARIVVALSLAAANAHADPSVRLTPELAVTPELAAHLERERPHTLGVDRVHVAVARQQPVARGLDGDLALLVERASDTVANLVGTNRGVGAFLHVENVVSGAGPAAPRLVVLGFSLGARSPAFASPLGPGYLTSGLASGSP